MKEKIKKQIYQTKKILLIKNGYPCKNVHSEYSELRPKLMRQQDFSTGFLYGQIQTLNRILTWDK